jgi:hypothetical protein
LILSVKAVIITRLVGFDKAFIGGANFWKTDRENEFLDHATGFLVELLVQTGVNYVF